jgi:hypothetical protein
MFVECLFAAALQIGPFWQQTTGHKALCPVWSHDTRNRQETHDVLWPLFTSHRDWWRFCGVVHCQRQLGTSAGQFQILPIWFNGTDRDGDGYWGLFPLWGRHPHLLLMDDFSFALWPLWMRYRTPRPQEERMMTTTSVLFPFFHWRDDGSWGAWPLAGRTHQRASDHTYALWPFFTWAEYEADRDTSGYGSSWMAWPLAASVARERETQTLIFPPFFSFTELKSPSWSARGNSAPEMRLRAPWPFFEVESTAQRDRLSLFPFYERVARKRLKDGACAGRETRFGWRLFEIYEGPQGHVEETRVFPFWLKNRSHLRVWPFYSSTADATGEVVSSRALHLFPIRWVEAIDRNFAPYWTFYESVSDPIRTRHSLFWGIIKWQTFND